MGLASGFTPTSCNLLLHLEDLVQSCGIHLGHGEVRDQHLEPAFFFQRLQDFNAD